MSNIEDLPTEAQMALVWKSMREAEIDEIEVSFSGSGDSGQVDGVDIPWSLVGPIDQQERDRKCAALSSKIVSVSDYVPPSIKLTNLVERLSDEIILQKDELPDWYNNDGGNGTINWIADRDGTNRIEVTVNVAVIEYDTSTFTYGETGEEIVEE